MTTAVDTMSRTQLKSRLKGYLSRLASYKEDALAIARRGLMGGASLGGGAAAGYVDGLAVKNNWTRLHPDGEGVGGFSPVTIAGVAALGVGVIGGRWLGDGMADGLTGFGSGVLAYKSGASMFKYAQTDSGSTT